MSQTPLLDRIQTPHDLRQLTEEQLPQVAAELRAETINAVSVTGGHLGAGLGVIELTVALHWVFNTPEDRLIWDVGHQAYPHKIITGRRDRIRTLRQPNGLSGFTKRDESPYDPFGAAHSSTSISAALGMAVARDLNHGTNNVIAVIGDGAMSAGMAYEALNNAGARDERLIVILNDNDMSIAPPTGAMSAYLARVTSSGTYLHLRDYAKQLVKMLPKQWERRAARVEEYTRHIWQGGAWFEELGFYYVGPLDGHDFDQLLPVLKNVRDAKQAPILVHVVTKKGKGYGPAEAVRRQISRRQQVQCRHRRAGEAEAQCAELYEGLRRQPDCRSAQRQPHRRDHGRDAVGYGARSLRQGISGSHVRCRHRRAACRNVRGRSRDRRL